MENEAKRRAKHLATDLQNKESKRCKLWPKDHVSFILKRQSLEGRAMSWLSDERKYMHGQKEMPLDSKNIIEIQRDER